MRLLSTLANLGSSLQTSQGTPHSSRVFEPMEPYLSFKSLEVEGKIPVGVRGTLFSNGPGRYDLGAHFFNGPGQMRVWDVREGEVSFRSRAIEVGSTDSLWNRMFWPQNLANTNAMLLGGQFLALWEGGRPPLRIDRMSLETLGPEYFNGSLTDRSFFGAHPHTDPETGEFFNIGFQMSLTGFYLNIWKLPPESSSLELFHRLKLGQIHMIHDFALTSAPPKGRSKGHVVVLANPYSLHPLLMIDVQRGGRTLSEAFRWEGEKPTLAYVVPRNGQAARTYQLPSDFFFHVANAYEEEDGTVIVDFVRYPDSRVIKLLARLHWKYPEEALQGKLVRLSLFPDGGFRLRNLHEPRQTENLMATEFPRVHPSKESKPYDFCFMRGFGGKGYESAFLVRVDTRTGEQTIHNFGRDFFVDEPVVVESPADPKGPGFVITTVYNPREHRTSLVFLPAGNGFGEKILAQAHLPTGVHCTPPFHNNFSTQIPQ